MSKIHTITIEKAGSAWASTTDAINALNSGITATGVVNDLQTQIDLRPVPEVTLTDQVLTQVWTWADDADYTAYKVAIAGYEEVLETALTTDLGWTFAETVVDA